jgi:GNAT superfamily N-acetyltransferase
VLSVLTLAFANDAIARWAVPDARHYLASMPATVRSFGGKGFASESVYLAENGSGAATWLPPGIEPDFEAMMSLLQTFSTPERCVEMGHVFEAMDGFHPKEPHWYLPLIGVDPAYQNRGIGSALLTSSLQRIDEEHGTAYLESSSARSLALYQRHGFERVGEIQMGSSPTLVAMVRRPR